MALVTDRGHEQSNFFTSSSRMQVLSRKLKRLGHFFASLATQIDKHEIFLMAASLAYTTALAIAPFVLIILALTSLLDRATQENLVRQLTSSLGQEAAPTIQAIVENADKNSGISGLSSVIGLVVLSVSASALFAQMRLALDKINEHKDEPEASTVWGFIKSRFFSMGLVFAFAFLSIVSLMVSAAIAVLTPASQEVIWRSVALIANFALFATLFSAIYRFVPTDKATWKKCLASGFVSAGFYLIGKVAIGTYLGQAGLGSTYGAAGTFIVFLVWVYYIALTLLVSYQVSKDVLFSNDIATRSPE
jgi:membrane protein